MMRAMILAAGRGERMRPLTDDTPKPLLAVGGKPLLFWHLDALAQAGFRDVVINVAWLGEQIRTQVGDGRAWNLRIEYSDEGRTARETAGGIVQALPLLGEAAFAVINGDVWTDFPRHLLRLPADSEAHLILVDNPPHHPAGDFGLRADLVDPDAAHRLTFSGLGVYHPALFAGLARGSTAPLGPLLRAAAARGTVTGEHYTGQWHDVGTPERLRALDQQLREA